MKQQQFADDPRLDDRMRAIKTETELWEYVKAEAKRCVHADTACQLVHDINNRLDSDARWRDWHCSEHNYSGHGAAPYCPKCAKG